jgi:hypothetical protein
MTTVHDIIRDVWSCIVEYIPDEDVAAVSMTCKKFEGITLHRVTTRNDFETVRRASIDRNLDLLKWFAGIWDIATDLCSLMMIRSNSAEILDWYGASYDNWNPVHVQMSVSDGYVESLRWLHDRRVRFSSGDVTTAVLHGRLEVLQYLYSIGYKLDDEKLSLAANNNSMDIVEFMVDKVNHKSNRVISGFMKYGNLRSITWMVDNGFRLSSTHLGKAVRHNLLDHVKYILKKLIESRRTIDHSVYKIGRKTSVDIVTYLSVRYGLPSDIMSRVCYAGNSKLMFWLSKQDYTVPANACNMVIQSGNIKLFKWCVSKGMTMSADVMSRVVQYHDLDLVKWCRENGCPWDDRATSKAVHREDLETFKWLMANGCPHDVDIIDYLFEMEDEDVVIWLVENRFLSVNDALRLARENSNPIFITWLESELVRYSTRDR